MAAMVVQRNGLSASQTAAHAHATAAEMLARHKQAVRTSWDNAPQTIT